MQILGVLTNLMQAANPAVRAAAVSTMTKLAIKAKALEENSPELSHILHSVMTLINSFDSQSEISKNNNGIFARYYSI